MKIDLVSSSQLTPDLIARWDEIVRGAPELASPYFRPEFTQAVAAIRNHVEIALLQEGNDVVGFFPFERAGGRVARPVGGKLSDYQGVIAGPQVAWRPEEIMRACQVKAWEFDHQLASQRPLARHFAKTGHSRRIDISAGFDTYLAGRRSERAGALAEMMRKFRKLQREHSVRFEWHTADPAVFDKLLAWKSQQYRRSELTDLFTYPWIVSLLKRIWQQQSPQFAGVLSAMYVNDEVAAVHFGMQSVALLHYWFPAYDVGLGKYSPGNNLVLFLLQQANDHGVACIDLGKGDEDYKLAISTQSVPLAEGVVETRPVSAVLRRSWGQARDWVRQSPFHDSARVPIGWLRRMREWLALR
jgi:CelD/BcsL family acetyltransferase involved in cellulose biosynthesis